MAETARASWSGRDFGWLALYGGILSAWALLAALSLAPETGPGLWSRLAALCAPMTAGLGPAIAMWALMSAAMMLPTALPAIRTYGQLPLPKAGLGGLVTGYLVVWLGFAVVAAAAQTALGRAGLLTPAGNIADPLIWAAFLGVAGLWQFSTLKEACLARCRHPIGFFMAHWSDRPFNDLKLGLRLGVVCLVCCWALMALAFLGGVMSLAFMGLAMVLMTLEKLPTLGSLLTRPLGFALVGGAVMALWLGLGGNLPWQIA